MMGERDEETERLRAERDHYRESFFRILLDTKRLTTHLTELGESLREVASETEKREDGKVVRKDRWETGMRRIARLLVGPGEFEIDDLVERVRQYVEAGSEADDV